MLQEETQQEKSIQGKIRIKTLLYGIKEFKEKIRLFRKKVLWSGVKHQKKVFRKTFIADTKTIERENDIPEHGVGNGTEERRRVQAQNGRWQSY